MTSETRTFIDFQDILSIQLECLKCHAKVVRPIGNISHFPLHCESCGVGQQGAEWFRSDRDNYREAITKFSTEIERLGGEISKELVERKLKLSLEIRPLVSQKSEQVL
jgi:hypothetical protein